MATIVQAIVDVAKDLGASSSASAESISEALDLLNDTLAGSDQTKAHTIAEAFAALGAHMHSVPTGTKNITSNGSNVSVENYEKVTVNVPAYVVTFDANTGTGTQAPMACAKGSSITLPTETTMTAPSEKSFKGWGTTADATTVKTTLSASANTVLYAIWQDAS